MGKSPKLIAVPALGLAAAVRVVLLAVLDAPWDEHGSALRVLGRLGRGGLGGSGGLRAGDLGDGRLRSDVAGGDGDGALGGVCDRSGRGLHRGAAGLGATGGGAGGTR